MNQTWVKKVVNNFSFLNDRLKWFASIGAPTISLEQILSFFLYLHFFESILFIELVDTPLSLIGSEDMYDITTNGNVVLQRDHGNLKIRCTVPLPDKAMLHGPHEDRLYGHRYHHNDLMNIHTYYLGLPKIWHSGIYTCSNRDGTKEHSIKVEVTGMFKMRFKCKPLLLRILGNCC